MTTLYVTIMEDNRTDAEVAVFADREIALRSARLAARNQRLSELNLHPSAMTLNGGRLLFWASGGAHEANLRVVEREVIGG